MKKRILVLLLALVTVAGFALPAAAAQDELVSDEPLVIADDPAPTTEEETASTDESGEAPAPASDEAAATALLDVMPVSDGDAPATQSVSYVDKDGNPQTATATKVTSSTTTWGADGTTTWYYVDADTTIDSGVTVTGDVNLILCDGATLTVTIPEDSDSCPGVHVNSNCSLTIYGQTGGTGSLSATGNREAAGIRNYGTLTVNGGEVRAACGDGASNPHLWNGGNMTINGGKVTAAGGGVNSTGISNSGNLTINGGEVTATGNHDGNGIFIYNNGSVVITGGTVKATAGTSGEAVRLRNNAALTLPATRYWRTAGAEGTKYRTQASYDASALSGKYFEVTTTAPDDTMLDRVGYLDWDSTNKCLNTTLSYREGATKVTSSTTTWGADGTTTWYYVDADTTIDGKVTVTGNVNLILCDGKTLTVNGGLNVGTGTEQGAGLTIYGQSGQSGALVVSSGKSGIFVAKNSSLTVNGGNIEAKGWSDIYSHGISLSGTGGAMTVNGGKVAATGAGSSYSYGIFISNGASLTVNGGEVMATDNETASASSDSFGISLNNGTVNINGGKVICKGENAVFKSPTLTEFTPPTTYYWRTAADGKYKTKSAYTESALEGEYFELTTTKPSSIEPYVTGSAATVTYGDAVDGSVITATTTDVKGTFAWKDDVTGYGNVGTRTLMATFTPSESGYVPVDVEVSVTVNKKPLTVTANDHSITYGDEAANNGVSYDGFVTGDSVNDLTGALAYEYTYSQYDNAGSYTITPKGLAADNYDITFKPGALTVEPKTIGIDWTDTKLTHNGKAQKPTATATGLVNDDKCAITVTGEQTEAGTYTATATGLDNPNYKLPEDVTCEFTIAAAKADGKGKAPQTGDAGIALYVLSAASSMTGLVWLGRKKKR